MFGCLDEGEEEETLSRKWKFKCAISWLCWIVCLLDEVLPVVDVKPGGTASEQVWTLSNVRT